MREGGRGEKMVKERGKIRNSDERRLEVRRLGSQDPNEHKLISPTLS